MKPIKLCFCASSGGHYWTMLQLKALADKYPNFIITERLGYKEEALAEQAYFMPMLNRRKPFSIFLLFYVAVKSFFVVLKEKPTHIIANGAFITVPAMLIGKLLGKKIVFFETTARVSSPSLTGKLAYKFFADLFIVQYDSMLNVYPKAQVGSVI
ncbi:MAG: UDP-N-acetylglucosamine transferase subunit ALG14 [Fibromonadales bacterium]|nr:UDP-N-acetylglucosamine transferase subunit ALG14 [Fibromonadales bacterium]